MKIDIVVPEYEDLEAIVQAQANAWLATYISPENGVSEEWVRSVTESRSAGYIAERLKSYQTDQDKLYVVAKDEYGTVLGFLHAEKNDNLNTLLALYVDPKYIGTGAGGSLMKHALDWFDNSKPIELEVTSYNDRAIGFYEHYGFNKTDRELPKFRGIMPVIEMVRSVAIDK